MAVPTGYSPSQYAKAWNVIAPNAPGGSAHLALDLFTYDSAIGPFVVYALLQQAPDGHGDYMGNMAPPALGDGNLGKLWEMHVGDQTTYAPPGGTAVSGGFSDIANQVKEAMILDARWIQYIKAAIQRILFGAQPVPGGVWPAADWTAALANLQVALRDKIDIVNGVPVVKT